MELENIPLLRSNKFPERITTPITGETKRKLDALKRKRKDTAELVRRLIDEFLDKIPADEFNTSA